MNKKRWWQLAIFMAVFVAGVMLFAGLVQPILAKAGGTGDFYTNKSCTASKSGTKISGVKGLLSNYDIHNYADERYHHGVSINRSGWYLATAPLYDDESWPVSQSEIWDAMGYSGTRTDGTQDFDIKSTVHTVTFIFSNGSSSASCSIKS